MISVFFSHVCSNGEKEPCLLCNRIAGTLKKDLPSIYPFLSCQDLTCNNPQDLEKKVKQSHFFIPFVCSNFSSRPNCTTELQWARDQQALTKEGPWIFPVKYGCDDSVLTTLGFKYDLGKKEGDRWADFSDSNFDIGYEDLYQRIHNKALDSELITDEDFHKDIKILDIILNEANPTSGYVKTAIDYCRKGEEYGLYFFKRLQHESWLSHLRANGFFGNNPSPISVESDKQRGLFSVPFWPVLVYLEKISNSSNKKIQLQIMDIIRRVSNPPLREDNYRTWYSFVKIMANLPVDIIETRDVDLITYWLDSKFHNSLVAHEVGRTMLPKFLASDRKEDWKKAEKIVDIVTRKGSNRPTMLDSHDLDELFEKNAARLGERRGEQVSKLLAQRIEEVVGEKDNNYCYIWRAAIEDHEQNVGTNQPKHALISGLRDVLLSYAGKCEAWDLLKELFNKQKFILRRIVLYVLNCQFHKYRDQCQELILKNTPDLFLETNYRHEFYELMRAHFREFTQKKQDQIIDKIDQLAGQWAAEIPAKEQEGLNNEIRSMWLKAIEESGYQLSTEMNTKYDLANYRREHPEFPSYMGPVNWGDEQLFSVGELMAKGTVKGIVDYLNGFQGKNRFNEPGYEEAGQVLKQAVKSNQQFFEKDINEFLQARYVYQYYALQAFEEIWNDKRSIAWGKILELSLKIVETEELWKEEPEKKQIGLYVRKDWISSVIAKLIHNGVKDDSWVMPDEHLPLVRKILIRIFEKQKSLPADKWKDAEGLTNAINSAKGQAIEAFISCCLRQCRIFEKNKEKAKENKEVFWKEVEPVFNREVEKARNDNFEFSAIAGAYLPNLYYLSKEWVEQNINQIFPKESKLERNWLNAMSGYSYVNTVYTAIYNLLKGNGQLEKALKTDFQNWRINDRMVGNVAIAYLRGQEELNAKEGPFSFIFQSIWDDQYIEDIIDVFWQHRDERLPEEAIQRILAFWQLTLDHVARKGIEQYKQTLSDLNLLATYLPDKLSEEQKQWLLQCASYVDERHHSTFFLEYLDRLTNSNPKEIREIFLAMLEKTIPTYKEENIRSIVEKLYKAHEKVSANQVCDRYSRAGYEFLRDLFEQYNK